MLSRRIIPCLDVRDGRVVKGIQFQGLRDAGDPVERAIEYADSGADELVLLDVAATLEARAARRETIRAVRRAISIPFTVGGGVRTVAQARELLESGADKVSLNTAAVRNPELVSELAAQFGRQCTVVAIDAVSVGDGSGDGWEIVVSSGSERTGICALEWARQIAERGAGELLLTSWDRDGTKSGYDTALLTAVRTEVSVPIIASGGAAGAEHMAAALRCGADAVLAASIFHDGETTVASIKQELARMGVEVRP